MLGKRLQKYEILEEIGHGGMAVVYRGRDLSLEREVAVKVLHPHLQSQTESKQRFHREAKAVAKLRHPNILEIYDYSGADSDDSFIVTEFIHGPTLKAFVDKNPVPIEVGAMIVLEVCHALAHAHAQGVIHRDIKPENIMVREDGVIKLTDFGIAQMVDTLALTVTGQILGSPAHMSPEHVEGGLLDFRADVFSVGTLLYVLATGRLPFDGKNPHTVLKKIVECDYVDPMSMTPAMGSRLAAIICKCLQRKRDDRYASVELVASELQAFLLDLELSDPAAELRRFFSDPPAYAAQHAKRIVGALTRRGQEQRRAGNVALALDYFNRVLAIDEKNAEVLALVGGIERRRRRLRVASVGAGALVAAAVLGLTVDWLAGRVRDVRLARAREKARTAAAESADIGRPSGSGTPSTSGGASTAQVGRSVRGRANAAPEARPARTVVFLPQPRAASIWVDGVLRGDYGPSFSSIRLPPGRHRFRFAGADGCCVDAEWEQDIPAGPGETRVARSLVWRAAKLLVETNVAADVDVEGRAEGRARSLIEVPIRNGPAERLAILVRADGYQSVRLPVEVRAGKLATVRAVLTPEGAPPVHP